VRHGEFIDRRLVDVYDAECPWSRDDDYFSSVVGETPSARVLDLGCGTGRLALGLARAGHAVTGIDPARASLAAAQRKDGAAQVTWVEGTSSAAPDAAFDVAVMTSHVAQFFVDDAEWMATLADLRRALVPNGRLAFDARDPRDRAWERWNPIDSHRVVTLDDGEHVTIWTEVTSVQAEVVAFTHHYRFANGDDRTSEAVLRFRTEERLRETLADAGFTIEHVFGGWRREPVGLGDGELLVIARSLG
jgi:SAM-dependent methyltransferase